ncbi:MAG: biotin--[acetyl-CoA-carboxylase] ligase [Fusobacteriaceae bacterium]
MRIFRLDEINSTNTYAKEMETIENHDLIIAKQQSSGRGRRGNLWESELGAGLFTFIIENSENLDLEKILKLPLVMGFSVLKALKNHPELLFNEGLDFKFKWTNDIYLNNKKISGILMERYSNFFIIGIGVNINNREFREVSKKATSIFNELGKELDIESVIFSIVIEIKKQYKAYLNGGWEKILEEINKYNFLKNKNIEVFGVNEEIEGRAGDISEDGTLEISTLKGIRKLNIGEVHIKI